jgi:hypothetical protein
MHLRKDRRPNQKLPDHAAGPMSTNTEHQVDDACQNDEPGDDHVDRTTASKGEPIATMPNMISRTPHTIDNVEACRRCRPDYAAP